ncbi:MAG: hypothetical protein HC888_05420 [Candidatus Competibacteraceae bacterium]|nr:hypothetical protein [Candidatus Competibacteraceae bacterium]
MIEHEGWSFGDLLRAGIERARIYKGLSDGRFLAHLTELVGSGSGTIRSWRDDSRHPANKEEHRRLIVEIAASSNPDETTKKVFVRADKRVLDWTEWVEYIASFPEGRFSKNDIDALLEEIEGRLHPKHSGIYLRRPVNERFEELLRSQLSRIILVTGLPGVGKSELIRRGVTNIDDLYDVAYIAPNDDFEQGLSLNKERFLREFCRRITERLALPINVTAAWGRTTDPINKSQNFLWQYVLPQLKKHLLLIIDPVDLFTRTTFRNDFFRMLRGLGTNFEERRSSNKVYMVLSSVTELDKLTTDGIGSPLGNSVSVIRVSDYTRHEVTELHKLYGEPCKPRELQELSGLVNGHPLLLQTAFQLLRDGESYPHLMASAASKDGCFQDTLRPALRLVESQSLVEPLKQIAAGQRCQEDLFFALRDLGLAMRSQDGYLLRYPLLAKCLARYYP